MHLQSKVTRFNRVRIFDFHGNLYSDRLFPRGDMTQAHTVISDDSIRKSAKEIFETNEFRQEETAYLFQKWLNKMGDLLNSFQDWTAAHPAYTWLLIAGLMIILILLIAHIVYSAFGDSLGGSAETRHTYKADRSLEVLEGKATSWRQGFEKANSALASGQSQEAIWIGHRVLLGWLDEAGSIHFQGHKTNTAYLIELGPQDARFDLLNRFTSEYEAVVYGNGSCDTEEIRSLLDELMDRMQESS